MGKWLRSILLPNVTLLLGSLVLSFLIIEAYYRVFDPFPYFSPDEFNFIGEPGVTANQFPNLSEYDETLGWKGISGAKEEYVDDNNRVLLMHNGQGFRDVEHDDLAMQKEAIVFLGDSFTWGFEVEFGEMFVNRLRGKLPTYTIVNLSHRGYGTDQELLTFKRWCCKVLIRKVILMFCENDVNDNKSTWRYGKTKPAYQIVEGRLVLTNVPVPKVDTGEGFRGAGPVLASRWQTFKRVLMHSHFLHDIAWRSYLILHPEKQQLPGVNRGPHESGLLLTSLILRELKDEVEKAGATLLVVFIPSKKEIEQLAKSPPYQIEIADICEKLGIEYLDLAPKFKKSWRRTYYRIDMHWNAHGHEIAADVLHDYLSNHSPS